MIVNGIIFPIECKAIHRIQEVRAVTSTARAGDAETVIRSFADVRKLQMRAAGSAAECRRPGLA
jgi:hypothetical protein